MTIFKFLGFTMLMTLVFMPLINLVLTIFQEKISDRRKNTSAYLLSAILYTLYMTMGLQMHRFVIQAFLSYLILIWMMKFNMRKALYIMITMYAITAVVEFVIVSLCRNTVISFNNIIEIDTFYALMIALQAAVLWLMYILSERSIRQFHRERALKRETLK